MKRSHSRLAFLLLVVAVATPTFAAAIAADVTIPVAGYLVLPGELTYRTELTVTNHRDVLQYIRIDLVMGGFSHILRTFALQPLETKFLPEGAFPANPGFAGNVGAMRFTAIQPYHGGASDPVADPTGLIEASGYVVAERGRFASRGSSRQEVAGIPSSEYAAEEAMFVGVRHDEPTYTNVGIVNLHATQTETFYVQFQYLDPIAVVVPPLSLRQIRIPGPGNGGRSVRVYPEWAIGDGEPVRTTPWVAHASTVDGYTGDAFSGTRVPIATTFRQ